MPLKEQLQSQGSFLFRWRSFLPLLLLPFAILALRESGYLVQWVGEPVEEAWEFLCSRVLRPEAPLGAWPTVSPRNPRPSNEMARQKNSHASSTGSPTHCTRDPDSRSARMAKGSSRSGRKLRQRNRKLPCD